MFHGKLLYARLKKCVHSASLGRVAALHGKWVRGSLKGALCSECQELNALHSQSVDGASIRIPERLTTPPESTEPYIVDLLAAEASKFASTFLGSSSARVGLVSMVDSEDAQRLLAELLGSKVDAISEYEIFNIALRLSKKHSFDLRPLLGQFDFGAFTSEQKHAISYTLNLDPEEHAGIWNSLLRSDILTPKDLYERSIDQPFSLHRLYSSKLNGLATFFPYLRMATQDYTRKILIMKVPKYLSAMYQYVAAKLGVSFAFAD